MNFTSTRLFQKEIGDSKVSLFKLSDSDDYVILFQDKVSSDLAIVGKENGEHKIVSDDGTFSENQVIIDYVSEKQLSELGQLLLEKFPQEQK